MKSNSFSTPLRSSFSMTPGLVGSATSINSRVDPKDLEELIGSLGIELYTPAQSKDIVKSILDSSAKATQLNNGGTTIDHSGKDVTAVHYGTKISLRGVFGRYLGAVSTVDTSQDPPMSSDSVNYLLEADGMGLGNDLECLEFVPIDAGTADNDVLTFGSLVAIKISRAKERLLGVRDGKRLGFWRNLIGQSEKWTILRGSAATHGQGRAQVEDTSSRGRVVHIGDPILLQAGPLLSCEQTTSVLSLSELLLTLHEGVDGVSPRLVAKDSVNFGSETWILESFGSPPLPMFFNRPYLSGRFLLAQFDQRKAHVPDLFGVSGPLSEIDVPSMGSLSLSAQIDVMIAEVLLAMSGIEGSYIRTTKSHQGILAHHRKLRDVALTVAGDDLDRSVADQVAGLLPLCQSTLIVREFVRTHSQYHYGLVSHALAAEVRTLLREVDVLISHLDELFRNGQLTLQKLIFMLQPTATIMRNLADLCTKLERTRGGEMLDVLYGSIFEQGDAKTRELYTSVFYKAIHPFIKMLENWLFRGKLEDVFDEFLVRENGLASREALAKDFHSQYWDERFTLNDKHIPRFLVPFAIKILVAGKYLNVVRDTKNVSIFGIIKDSERDNAMEIAPDESSALQGDDVEYDPSPAPLLSRATPLLTEESVDKDDGSSGLSLAFDMDAQDKLALSADRCYRLSSRALLKLLEQEHGLTAHLRSLRCYFLLEHGDFFTQFMDLAQVDLAKEVKEIRLVRVQALLQQAITSSTLSNEAHREDLTCSLEPHNLIQHLHMIQMAGSNNPSSQLPLRPSPGLTGVEALTLDYRVKWPLSILLSRRAITKYQLLSRILFFSKYVEREVLSSWRDHQSIKALSVRREMGPYFCLRQRMLHFLQNFVYYMTVEVIKPRDHEMQVGLSSARDMDEVLLLHEKFLDSCLKECLLASQEVLTVLTKIMATCLLFAEHVASFSRSFDAVSADLPRALSPKRPVRRGRLSTASQGSTEEEVETLALQAKAKQSAVDRARRKALLVMQTDFIKRESRQETFERYLMLFQDRFDKEISEFLEKLWTDSYRSHPQLSNLCVRLDYNGYYSQKFVTEVTSTGNTSSVSSVKS